MEERSELHQSVALVLIGGLLTSTFLTLVFEPAMDTVFDDLQEFVMRLVRQPRAPDPRLIQQGPRTLLTIEESA